MEYKVNIHYYPVDVVNLQKEEPEPRREEREKRREEKIREVEICARGVIASPLALEQG